MRFGAILISFILIELLLFMFGYINNNSLIVVLLGGNSWKALFSFDGLMGPLNMILSLTTVVGIVQKNSYIIFGSIALFFMDSIFGMSGIIGVFPKPFGHLIFGIFSFVYIWLVLEWWRLNDN